jgi:NADH:ubiquinone oxidoreductase subunit 5 (subunit L)/multisubunit Na+/H+ antiporter MnhA subunit
MSQIGYMFLAAGIGAYGYAADVSIYERIP